jgi:probable phosphoglycerate mutase
MSIARHGETNYNELGLCNSDPEVDVHLTDVGQEQARELAKKLKDVSIDQIYVSRLRRTKQTADIVNQYHSAPISVDARLDDTKSGYENDYFSKYSEALTNLVINDCTF